MNDQRDDADDRRIVQTQNVTWADRQRLRRIWEQIDRDMKRLLIRYPKRWPYGRTKSPEEAES